MNPLPPPRDSRTSAWRLSLAFFALVALLAPSPVLAQGTQEDSGNEDNVTEAGNRPVPRTPSAPVSGSDFVDPRLTGSLLPPADDATPLSHLLPVYFPQPAPALDSELPAPPAIRDPVWSEMAPDYNAPFYAPLSTRVAQGPLNRRLRLRLEAHRAAAAALLAELRQELERLPSSLGTLSAKHETPLAEHARQGDELRRELAHSRFLNRSPDWNAHRNWQLGDSASRRSQRERLHDEFSVLRAAIYYQEGLSPLQRQLLREIVGEIAATLDNRAADPLADSFAPVSIVYFHPFASRIRLPDLVPAAVQAGIDAFTRAKSVLKQELREALVRLDRESESKRERQLAELAVRQAPRFDEIAAQAEAIRIQLAALPPSAQPAVQPGLPPALVTRIEAYLREKAAIQLAAQKQAAVTDSPRSPKTTPADRAALLDFENQNRDRLAALSREAAAIRGEVALATTARGGDSPAKPVDALLAEFMRAFKHQQLQAQYRDYRAAVLTPGLSPAQRQLLFDAALASLGLIGEKDWQAVPE